ncbi:uncharacterized protein LOC131656666 isoform X1 [Vicia villosa]|uniref:uncharacterized protein LOC131656666 isoform X1 n=1 Tax=Vicia villosa TaxID=3911 RepID=UPI00273AB9F3|nr:uncharacterized protein LOC131656666 isoform X1 [Vicia villosa]
MAINTPHHQIMEISGITMEDDKFSEQEKEDDQLSEISCQLEMEDDKSMEFWDLVLGDDWDEVIKKYNEDSNFHKIDIKGRGTALHVAVSMGRRDDVVKSLVEAIEKLGDESSLKMMNEIGATPLHVAAYAGFLDVCKLIIGKEGQRKYLIQVKNFDGETPLFWAVNARQMSVFLYLQQFYRVDLNIAIDNNLTSILHVAIDTERYDMAIIIMHHYKVLTILKNKDDITPLEILATKTSAFISRNTLSWRQRILYYCLPLRNHDAKEVLKSLKRRTIFKAKVKNEKDEYSEVQIPIYDFLEMAQKKPHSLAKIMSKMLVFMRLIVSLLGLKAIITIKMKHIYGGLLLKEMMKIPIYSLLGGGVINLKDDLGFDSGMETKMLTETKVKSKAKTTAYLTAASHGIVEIMSELESKTKSVVSETNFNNENVLLLAVKNRQPHVIQRLKNDLDDGVFQNLYLRVNKDKNTMLHLAAYTSYERENTWRISGAAMQLTWDIKWYKYIKELVPEHFNNKFNNEEKTPSDIFKEQHKELLQDSVEWLKDTSESCSVVAALIAGVSFATSGSVPGGNQQTGVPALKGQPAFEVFAISSLIGLYFSVTSLVMFLSILTSRKEVEEFHQNMPMKLLFGLSSLFVSIVAMLVSFCAGHFFVLADKYTMGGILFSLYISICFPVAFYAAAQFPLFIDLVKVVWKKVPPPSIRGVLL